jgi:hypothetical protein
MQFRHSSIFKHIIPDTPKAQEFFDEYGGIFGINQQGMSPEGPILVLSCADERQIVVVKKTDGIYIDNKKFCKTDWSDDSIEANA